MREDIMDFMAAAIEVCEHPVNFLTGAISTIILIWGSRYIWKKTKECFFTPAPKPFRNIKTVPIPDWIDGDNIEANCAAPADNGELFPGIKKVTLPSYKNIKKKPPTPR